MSYFEYLFILHYRNNGPFLCLTSMSCENVPVGVAGGQRVFTSRQGGPELPPLLIIHIFPLYILMPSRLLHTVKRELYVRCGQPIARREAPRNYRRQMNITISCASIILPVLVPCGGSSPPPQDTHILLPIYPVT